MNVRRDKSVLIILLSLLCFTGVAQVVPQGITYQGLARNSGGSVIVSQAVSLRVGIYSPTVGGTLKWEEDHALTTNQFGLFYCIIGQGVSTGLGSETAFSGIDWSSGAHVIKIAMDETGGSSFVNIDTIQFWSVPYALYSGSSGSLEGDFRLSELTDVDTIGVAVGNVLKWNGTIWYPAADNDSDTAAYAFSASHSLTSDTADYAVNVLSAVDTVPFAFSSDSASYSLSSASAGSAVSSAYCDTAAYALNSGSSFLYWNLNGNSGTNPLSNYIGTSDNADLVVKTNNTERMRVSAGGKIGIGTASPTASLHIVGNNGLVAEGTFGTGIAPPAGAGTRMVWYPKKGAFRSGGVSSTQWNDANIGDYSFASGFNTTGSGAYSTVFGSGSTASGAYSFAACELSVASGLSSISLGNACTASGAYSVAMGRGSIASDSSAVAMGYHPTASGKYAFSLGYGTVASGDYSFVLGYNANSNGMQGSFVYADPSSNFVTNSTANNQFMARASGGVIFYSNALLTAGVSLPAGGGSWASVSDKNKKEHFKNENGELVLEKLNTLDIFSWNYKTQSSSIRHIGPFAQDFYSLFGFGESDTTITTIDADGLCLLAIQALSKRTKELKKKSEEIRELEMRLEKIEIEKKNLERRIVSMEARIKKSEPVAILPQEGSSR